jgi:hypothetical protein
VRVADLLDRADLRLRLLTGGGCLDREIHSVYTTDLPDPRRFLTGGELVLTSTLWHRGGDDSARFVTALVEGKAAAHRVTDKMRARDPKAVPEPLQIFCAGVHRVWRARPDLGRAMAAEVGEHPLPAGRHQGNDFVPGPAALGEAMEERNRRAIADHLIVEPNVISHFENHK